MIKSYELLKIIEWIEEMDIENYNINEDGIVDVDGSVELAYKNLTSIPVQFGTVKGYFSCYGNQLTSLEGAPLSVGEWFDCSLNQLTSLKGAPQSVGSYFNCSFNQLTTLEGAPLSVGGEFSCFGNKKKFTEQEVRAVSKVRGRIFC